MNAFLAGPLIVLAAFMVAWAVASVIVEVADALGLVYSAQREARREERAASAPPKTRAPTSDLPSAIEAELTHPAPDPRGGLSRRIEERRRAAA